MKLEITVKANKYGDLFAFAPFELFQFAYRKESGRWLFWLKGELNPEVFPGKEFPMKFFLDACRAMFFLRNGGPLPDTAEIVQGKELIEKQLRKRR